MAWIDDIDVLNNAASSGDWTASGFDTPTLNDSSATTPIYLEGSACMWWPLKKGTTGGYTYTSTISGTPTLTGRICVGFLNYAFADIDAIPISSIQMRLSSSTGFTTNYIQWDARAQVLSPENVPISGHTPIVGYEDAGTETGTFTGTAEAVGWVATTGGSADGKQGGFDWFFLISWVGAHSATLTGTFFSGLYSEYFDNEGLGLPGETSRPIGVLSQAGTFFQTNVSFQLGHGTSDTANVVVTETGKTIFFNNLHANHELGYIFVNPASTHQIRLTLTDCVHFWNDQAAANDIFKNPANVDHLKVDGCSFANGGAVELPPHSVDRWIKTSKFDNCAEIDIGDGTFEDNTVANATSGVLYTGTGTRRSKNNTYTGCTDALHFDTAQTISLDGDQFSGNTTDIHFSGTGTLTINAINGANPSTSRVTGGGTVVINNTKTVAVTVNDAGTGSPVENARILVEAAAGGALPAGDTVTITRATTTATVTHTAHAIPDGEQVAIRGANEAEYNGIFTITVTGANSYTYTVSGTPATPATGTIKATAVVLTGLTNASGLLQRTDFNYGTDQPISGWARKGTVTPKYKTTPIAGTITSAGFSTTVAAVRDD